MTLTERPLWRAGVGACAFLAVCSTGKAGYVNATQATGIAYQHSQRSDPVAHHAGAAAFDADGDGWTDFIAARYRKAPVLFMNQGDGTFVEEGAARGLSGAQDAAGFGAGDFDNDGDQDLFMAPHKGPRYYLYLNDGDGNFVEAAVERGAAMGGLSDPHQGYSIGLVDYDLDGYLDIYVSEWGPSLREEWPQHSVLLRNRGAAAPGHFENATAAAGLTQPVSGTTQVGFSSGWADFDGDGWPDLALVADFKQSQMYWNDGDGTFTNATKASGVGFDENGMGVAVADYDGDGLLDFYVTSIYDAFSFAKDGTETGNKLYRNMGDRNFQEVAFESGVSRTGWGWGAAFLEYDNDGDPDLVATNGINLAEGGNPDTTPYVAAASDPTTFFENQGDGSFRNVTSASGISDTDYGKAIVVFDYDNDGDEDFVVTNTFGEPIVYRSDASENGNAWVRFRFQGTVSNRDGYGAQVWVSEGGRSQTQVFNPTNAYIGQREAVLHFGLGEIEGAIDRVEVKWPTGLTETYEGLAADATHTLIEPEDEPPPPLFSRQPQGRESYGFGEELLLEAEAIGTPEPVYVWEKDGEPIEGETGPRLRIKRLAPFDAGTYRVKAINAGGATASAAVEVALEIDLEGRSTARWWNEFLLEAIRKDFPDPTKHSRNLYHVSAAMWDAFWAYEPEGWTRAEPLFHREEVAPEAWGEDRERAQREAISHAAYTVLRERYKESPGAERSQAGFRWLMSELGFDPDDLDTEGTGPAAVGNRIGLGTLQANYGDGANELGGYADTSGYEPANEPLVLELSGTKMNDINRWQPLAFDFAISQNGIPLGALVQSFLGVNWRAVRTFAMAKTSPTTIAFDPGPPPRMGTESQDAFIDAAIEVIRYSSYLDPGDGVEIDISPGALLNNPLGSNDGTGRSTNPHTGEPYAPNVVKRADYGRILAEYWADGPASETPPGHWNSLHNEISDHPLFERRYMGQGEELSKLEWDVRAYLALNGGMHDAAIAAWTLKAQYDYSRPISMIRELCERGQSSDPDGPSYHPDGIRLVPGLVEVVTYESSAVGGRHEDLLFDVGKIAIRAWRGEPENPHEQVGGVGWILGEEWFPYQRSTFVTPAFGAYVSGHSTFSRSGAEVMTLLTGSPFFPGGLGAFRFPAGEGLEFEYGPSEDLVLQWATYYDAADQAGLSRLYGGIHVRADDFVGRTLGARVGVEAFLRAHRQRNGFSGSGRLAGARAGAGLSGGGDARLVAFRSEGKRLAIRGRRAPVGSPVGEAEGIFVMLPESAEAEAGRSAEFVASGPLVGVEVWDEIGEGERMWIDVELRSVEPELLLAYGQGLSFGSDVEDTRIHVYSITDDGLALVETNDDWRSSNIDSQVEALILRESETMPLRGSDAALSAALPPGRYRVEVEAASGSGRARLAVSVASWRDSGYAQ